MQASFEFKPEITNKPMVSVMTYLPKKYYSQGWPKNKAVHFVVDEIQADSIPPNFASAFLIECLLKGIKIPENLVLFGGMGAGGKLNYAVDKKRCDAPIGDAIKLTAEAAQRAGVDPNEDKPQSNFTTPSALGKKASVINQSFYLLTGFVFDGILDDLIFKASSIYSQVITCVALYYPSYHPILNHPVSRHPHYRLISKNFDLLPRPFCPRHLVS
jgi:hypothetical protein